MTLGEIDERRDAGVEQCAELLIANPMDRSRIVTACAA